MRVKMQTHKTQDEDGEMIAMEKKEGNYRQIFYNSINLKNVEWY